MCTVLLPSGVNPIAVNIHINTKCWPPASEPAIFRKYYWTCYKSLIININALSSVGIVRSRTKAMEFEFSLSSDDVSHFLKTVVFVLTVPWAVRVRRSSRCHARVHRPVTKFRNQSPCCRGARHMRAILLLKVGYCVVLTWSSLDATDVSVFTLPVHPVGLWAS
jgi:hypothetical protein